MYRPYVIEILKAMCDSGEVPELIQDDLVVSAPLYDKTRRKWFRGCYEFVGGKWEGFISYDTTVEAI